MVLENRHSFNWTIKKHNFNVVALTVHVLSKMEYGYWMLAPVACGFDRFFHLWYFGFYYYKITKTTFTYHDYLQPCTANACQAMRRRTECNSHLDHCTHAPNVRYHYVMLSTWMRVIIDATSALVVANRLKTLKVSRAMRPQTLFGNCWGHLSYVWESVYTS